MFVCKDMIRLNRNIFLYRILQIFFFILAPFLTTCVSFYLLVKQRETKVSAFLTVSFFGLLGYTLLPYTTMDLTRHYVVFEKMKEVFSLSDFVLYESISEKPDFFLDFLYWIIGKVIETHQIVGFIGAFLFYAFWIGIILHWRSIFIMKSDVLALVSFSLLFSFLSISPIYEFSGMRQGNAILLFLFIVTIPQDRISEWIRILLLLLPCFLHFSLYPIVILYLCTYRLKRRGVLILFICMVLGFFAFTPLMHLLMDICSSLGGIGSGIAEKIEDYIFNGELEAALYSGSVIRFIVILFLLFLSPFVIYIVDSNYKNLNIPLFMTRFHYFFILFIGYLIFSSSSYILSRNLMLFKFMSLLYLIYILYAFHLRKRTRMFMLCVFIFVCLSGPLSFFFGKEYQPVNFSIFYSNLFEILSIETDPMGYTFN